MQVRGRSGQLLEEAWDGDDARAYLGLAVPDFPNFFCLYGPNTQFGHGGSLLFLMELQMHYISDLLLQMFERGLASVECRRDVHDEYNARVDAAHDAMVWTHPGMDVYYRNSRGRVVVNNPFRIVDFWQQLQRADLDDFVVERTGRALSTAGPARR
jgi:4-hydroxyacetophenone monooxygenase